MEKLTREEIKQSINYFVDSAISNKNEARYYLEQLPVDNDADYDGTVQDFIQQLKNSINDADCYNFIVDDLVEHYFTNQESYDF